MAPIELPPFRLDPATRVLYRDAEIEPLPPRTIEVLLALLERRGELVTKQDLMQRVWPDTVVEEGNLSVHVSLLRKTLGDAAPIETVAKRGYRIPQAAAALAASPAREELLRGRHFWNKLNRTSLERAFQCFARAAEVDPASGEARSGQADTRIMQGLYGFEPGRTPFEDALAHADSALRLAPRNAQAQASFAFAALFARWDYAAAARSLAEARRLAPRDAEPLVWSALLSALEGRFGEALEQARAAHEIDPLSITAGVGLGFHLYLSQQHAPDPASLEAVLELEPDSAIAHWALGLAFDRLGRYAEAERSHARAAGLAGGSLTIESNRARSLALGGRHAEGQSLLEELEARGLSGYRSATVDIALGRPERALAALERALAEHDPWMVWTAVDPMLDPLRKEPAFAKLSGSLRPL